MTWLEQHIWPAEARHLSPGFVHDGSLLACAEMLRGGVTCFNDMYFYPGAVAKAALATGIRAAIGLIAISAVLVFLVKKPKFKQSEVIDDYVLSPEETRA